MCTLFPSPEERYTERVTHHGFELLISTMIDCLVTRSHDLMLMYTAVLHRYLLDVLPVLQMV
jgi:hypothetical protein